MKKIELKENAADGSNDLKISDAAGMAQDLPGESQWKASNFMGSVNTQQQVL